MIFAFLVPIAVRDETIRPKTYLYRPSPPVLRITLVHFAGLQKQMLFMRCVFESRLDKLDLYPFPGLKVINIRGSSLLALDLIIIGNFVAKLDEKNRLLEMALRDYPLDRTGLLGLIPCIPLIRYGVMK